MTDDVQGFGPGQQSGVGAAPATTTPKRVPPWVWIAVAVAVVALALGWYLMAQSARVPNVVGQTQADAEAAIQAAGFRVGRVTEEATIGVTPGIVTAQQPAADSSTKKGEAVDISVSVLPQATIPDVVGKSQSEAASTLAEEGLRVGAVTYVYDADVKPGYVVEQSPTSGATVEVGSAVDLTLSKGQKQGQVPNVVGLSKDDAVSAIEAAGFEVKTVKSTSDSIPAGDVISQSPDAGLVVPAGSTVTITVSTGEPAPPASENPPDSSSEQTDSAQPESPPATDEKPESPPEPDKPAPVQVTVPDVTGMRTREAIKTLRDAKLKVSFAFGPTEDGILTVIAQDPASGATVDPGTTAVITIGLPSLSLPDGKPTQPTPLPAEEPPAATTLPAPAPEESGSEPAAATEPAAEPSATPESTTAP